MSTVRNYLGFTINAVLHPAFNRKLCYKLSSIVTFTLIHNFLSKASNLPRLLDTASKFALFSVSGLKDEKLIKKSKYTRKLKHANSILRSCEYFCQISSKLLLTILSYTVSNLVHFWDTVLRCRALKAEGVQLYHMWPEGIDRPVFNSSL